MDAKDLPLEITGKKSGIKDHLILQRCVSHYRNLHATAVLEAHGHRVVNSFRSATWSSDKVFCSIALARAGVPTPRTYLASTEESAMKALDTLGYPAVIKPVVGSWGRLSALLKDSDFARAIIEDREYMYPMYQVYYLQEFVKRPPRDIRSFVVGDRTVAAIYRISTSDWRTNTARGGRAEKCPITSELRRALAEVREGRGGRGGGRGPHGVSETAWSSTRSTTPPSSRTPYPATGIDIPGLIVDYPRLPGEEIALG